MSWAKESSSIVKLVAAFTGFSEYLSMVNKVVGTPLLHYLGGWTHLGAVSFCAK